MPPLGDCNKNFVFIIFFNTYSNSIGVAYHYCLFVEEELKFMGAMNKLKGTQLMLSDVVV